MQVIGDMNSVFQYWNLLAIVFVSNCRRWLCYFSPSSFRLPFSIILAKLNGKVAKIYYNVFTTLSNIVRWSNVLQIEKHSMLVIWQGSEGVVNERKSKTFNIYVLLWDTNQSTVWKVSKYRVFSGPHFPAFGLHAERYSVSLRIQSECRKIRTRKNSLFGHFSCSGVNAGVLSKRFL